MAKLLAQVEGLAVPATIATAVHAKDTFVKITGDRTVDKAGANDFAIGRISVQSKKIDGIGTVETRFKELIECKTGGALSAGAYVKLAAVDGSTGENIVVAFTPGTDANERLFGVVWKGAGSGGVAEVLVY